MLINNQLDILKHIFMFLFEPELQATIHLSLIKNLGNKNFQKLMLHFHSAENAVKAPIKEWIAAGIEERIANNKNKQEYNSIINSILSWQDTQDSNHILAFNDSRYPNQLKAIENAPLLLYAKGDIKILHEPQIAIVGSRNATNISLQHAYYFADYLCTCNIHITSGLAAGIDTYAHAGTIKTGKTIAVLGTGIDVTYPKSNIQLSKDIIAKAGVLLSELPLNTPPVPRNFPVRNRIISGLSVATLVVEASINSGSLITARYTKEQHRLLFTIPHNITNIQAKGSNMLLRDGARCVTDPQDLINDLKVYGLINVDNNTIKTESKPPTNNPIINALSASSMTTEELALYLNMNTDLLLSSLTELEIFGEITQIAGVWHLVI